VAANFWGEFAIALDGVGIGRAIATHLVATVAYPQTIVAQPIESAGDSLALCGNPLAMIFDWGAIAARLSAIIANLRGIVPDRLARLKNVILVILHRLGINGNLI